MSLSKEEAYLQAKSALEKAQKKYDKALEAWQDEIDGIVLKPMRTRNLSRKQAVLLARAIGDDTIFDKIMEMGLMPDIIQKKEEIKHNENHQLN